VFVALKGLRADGGAFADQAAERGAVAIVSESPRPDTLSIPWITVRDARLALALVADRFFDHPSRRMPVIGVTGTNGKTTTAYLLASILDAPAFAPGCSAPSRTALAARIAKPHAPRRKLQTCSSC
jgi:UDP-N-acetylmuramoyl-L-alanyl-D-glutamate--2,6-diaminopimelate ligase